MLLPEITAISITNWIHAKVLNHRNFKQFLTGVDADYGDVLMHTSDRWLSRATCLNRFYKLLLEIKGFAEGKMIFSQLSLGEWIADLAFMVNITTHLSRRNRFLQVKDELCHNLCSKVSVFIACSGIINDLTDKVIQGVA